MLKNQVLRYFRIFTFVILLGTTLITPMARVAETLPVKTAVPSGDVQPRLETSIARPVPQPSESLAILDPAPESPPYPFPEQVTGHAELVEERAANSATFDVGDGVYALVQESQPLHYRDGEGNWERINPAFAGVTDGWLNATNALQISLARDHANARITTAQIGVGWESRELVLAGHASQAIPLAHPVETTGDSSRSEDGRAIVYKAGWSSEYIQERWESDFGQVEYSLALNKRLEPDTSPRGLAVNCLELRSLLHLLPGTYIEVGGEPLDAATLPRKVQVPLAFVDAQGNRLWLELPQAYEQNNAGARVDGSYLLAATDAEGTYDLRVQIPWAWLNDPQRSYPVVLDPKFQMRSGTTVLGPVYDKDLTFVHYRSPGVGTCSDGAQRLLVKFDLPTLPGGATINKAYLIATPTGQNVIWESGEKFLTVDVELYTLSNTDWIADSSYTHIDAAHSSLLSSQKLSFSNGDPTHPTSGIWDITDRVLYWRANPWNNNGLMFKTRREFCKAARDCGRLYFDPAQVWTDENLQEFEDLSIESAPYVPSTTTAGGVRLIVFYTGPTLGEGQILPSSGWTSIPTSGDPYYHTDHEYRLNSTSDEWVAVVTRGRGTTFGVYTPDDYTDVYGRYTEGRLPLELRSSADYPLLPESVDDASFQPDGGISYLILNGRNLTTQNQHVRVRPPAAGDAPSLGYDIRLLAEQGSLQVQPNGMTTSYLTSYNTDTPLALWNLDFSGLPAGANVRVQIDVSGVNGETDQVYDYARNFGAYLFKGNHDFYSLGSDGRIDLQSNAPPSGLLDRNSLDLNSPIITPDRTNYLLALAYNGPEISRILDKVCSGQEFCWDEINPLTFSYYVKVTACAQGTFPTKDGVCQQIKCPSSSGRAYSQLRLWSENGWSSDGPEYTISNDGLYAPLLGGPDSGDAPTVAVIGGQIRYRSDGAYIDLEITEDSTALIVDCGSLSSPRATVTTSYYFSVYDGEMSRIGVLDEDALSPPFRNNILAPWSPEDRNSGEANIRHYRLFPDTGVLKSDTTLKRYVGEGGEVEHTFEVYYQWDVGGWPSLTVTEVSRSDTNTPPSIASMLLDLGATFDMDVQPAGGKNDTRQFRALRAGDATVTLPEGLGGDSSDVQALILPRGQPPDPTEPGGACAGSCIDLRAPTDTPASPDREWSMPDVHTNVQPGMIIYNTAGSLEVYSVDHPLAAPSATPNEYSFDTAGGNVSIRRAPCTDGGPVVTIVEGDTRIAMPNIGGSPEDMIAASFKLCNTSLRHASFQFKSSSGIPIGNSGLFLNGMNGSVNINPGYTQINFGMDFSGGSSSVINGHGEVTIDTRGYFEFSGDAKLLGKVDANGKLWVAWNPMDIGFEVSIGYKNWLRGTARAHMWVGQGWLNKYSWLPDNNERHMTAQIGATITIKQGQAFSWWFIDIPPSTIDFSIEVAFGEFCTNSSCSRYEWGVKGKFSVCGYNVGLYYGFDHGFDFILGNDKHVLIDQHWGSGPTTAAADMAEGLNVRAAALVINGTATEAFEVGPDAEQVLAALGWQTGAPTLTIYDADGADVTAQYVHAISTTANSILMGVQIETPKPGAWRAEIGNLTGAENYQFVAFSNKGAPGTAADPGRFLAPVSQSEPGAGGYTIRWEVPDNTPISATIGLYYSHVAPPPPFTPALTETPTVLFEDIPIVKNLPFKDGQYIWDTTGVADGDYRLRAVVDDGVNDFPEGQICDPDDTCSPYDRELPPARAFSPARFPGLSTFSSSGTVLIEDTQAPDAPSAVTLKGVDGALLARWEPSTSRDVTSYRVRWGDYQGHGTWGIYTETWVTAVPQPFYRIGGVKNGQTVDVGIFAGDAAGNVSMPRTGSGSASAEGTAQVPGPPTNVSATGVSSTQLQISWDPPAGDAPISGYRVNYRCLRDSLAEAQTTQTSDTSVTLDGLETAAVYEITVQAHHDSFYGEASDRVRAWAISATDNDGDGLPDDWTAAYGIQDPADDDDNDGLFNALEYFTFANPTLQDSDGDGFSDFEEFTSSTDLRNAAAYPAAYLQPRLELAEDRLVFRYKQGQSAPDSQYVLIAFEGGDVFSDLVVSSPESWLQNTEIILTGPTYAPALNVRISPQGLEPGYYSGVMRVDRNPASARNLIGGGKCVRVALWVSPPDGQANPPSWALLYLPLIARGR